MNKIKLRYIFLYALMIAFIAPIRAGIQTDKYLFDGGYARLNSSTGNFLFFYYNKDHLGNNHEVLNHKGGVRQVTSYYPFGAPYADDDAISGTDIQPYKYNGKELDLMHGLNTYDYGARQYYSILGRWDRVDPLCERYYSTSPYAYCENDPVNAIDPDGRFGFKVLAKAAYKVGKTVVKNGLSSLTKSATYATAFNDVVEDANTVFDSNASTGDRVVAGLSLLSEIATPFSFKEGRKFVEKSGQMLGRSGTIISKKNGITIKTFGSNDKHKPAHAHVLGKGNEVRIGANGKPLKGEPELTTQQKKVVDSSKKEIRKEVNAIGKQNKKIEEYERNK